MRKWTVPLLMFTASTAAAVAVTAAWHQRPTLALVVLLLAQLVVALATRVAVQQAVRLVVAAAARVAAQAVAQALTDQEKGMATGTVMGTAKVARETAEKVMGTVKAAPMADMAGTGAKATAPARAAVARVESDEAHIDGIEVVEYMPSNPAPLH